MRTNRIVGSYPTINRGNVIVACGMCGKLMYHGQTCANPHHNAMFDVLARIGDVIWRDIFRHRDPKVCERSFDHWTNRPVEIVLTTGGIMPWVVEHAAA